MRLTHFFIDRPRFASVLSIFVTAVGLGALAILPVAQYPEIVPPTVRVTASYPGASAETVARTVATPLEQQINGGHFVLRLADAQPGALRRALQGALRTTTIASSTTMPTASTRPNSDRLLSDMPKAARIVNVPTRDTGIAMTGIMVARQLCRKRKTMPTTKRIATKIVTMTSWIEFAIKPVGS